MKISSRTYRIGTGSATAVAVVAAFALSRTSQFHGMLMVAMICSALVSIGFRFCTEIEVPEAVSHEREHTHAIAVEHDHDNVRETVHPAHRLDEESASLHVFWHDYQAVDYKISSLLNLAKVRAIYLNDQPDDFGVVWSCKSNAAAEKSDNQWQAAAYVFERLRSRSHNYELVFRGHEIVIRESKQQQERLDAGMAMHIKPQKELVQ